MASVPDTGASSRPASHPAASPEDTSTLVAWTYHDGDAEKSHVVHVDRAGMAWLLKVRQPEVFGRVVGEATRQPAEAAAVIEAQKGGRRLPSEQIARVAWCEKLNQLTVVDKAGSKQHFPESRAGEQGTIFEAVGRYLGGTAREEDADAWSVMKTPLFALSVLAVIGGFFIWFTTISDPNAEITGRRAGMKRLLNWVGYTIGPVWSSVIVGTIAALILGFMIFLLVKRPKRHVLEF